MVCLLCFAFFVHFCYLIIVFDLQAEKWPLMPPWASISFLLLSDKMGLSSRMRREKQPGRTFIFFFTLIFISTKSLLMPIIILLVLVMLLLLYSVATFYVWIGCGKPMSISWLLKIEWNVVLLHTNVTPGTSEVQSVHAGLEWLAVWAGEYTQDDIVAPVDLLHV